MKKMSIAVWFYEMSCFMVEYDKMLVNDYYKMLLYDYEI